MQFQNPQLYKKLSFHYKLKLMTGLRVGASKESGEIGGVDLPVVRRVDNLQPYIPGSSLKGKMRSLLKLVDGELKNEYKTDEDAKRSRILTLMGGAGDKGHGSRLLVRDAFLTADWVKRLSESDATDLPYTEVKFENTINLITGTADHPRQIERIPAGAEFDVFMVLNVVAEKGEAGFGQVEADLRKTLDQAVELLRHDYLGGMGSRGYGQVELTLLKEEHLDASTGWKPQSVA